MGTEGARGPGEGRGAEGATEGQLYLPQVSQLLKPYCTAPLSPGLDVPNMWHFSAQHVALKPDVVSCIWSQPDLRLGGDSAQWDRYGFPAAAVGESAGTCLSGEHPLPTSLAQWDEAQGTTVLEDEHPHAPFLRKLVNSKFVKSQSYRRQDMSNAPPKDVLRLSKKVGMVKGGTSGRNKAGREMLSIWRESSLRFLEER